jgi:triphosphoribosyl-dephospho-CoA synthase
MFAKQLSDYYIEACDIELRAFKPGNVSIYADGHDMTVEDFRISAKVSAEPLCNPNYCLGEKIYYAVKATREAVGCNTNLGIILLCAPLIEAAYLSNVNVSLRQALYRVLTNTTIADADWTFKAIKLASPAGLGNSEQHDVHQSARVTLREAMEFASDKDRIALQYLTDYKDIFDFSRLTYYNAMDKWGIRDWAAVAVYVDLLRQFPDSHIVRKYGNQHIEMVAAKMALLHKELSTSENPQLLIPLLYEIDREFKAKGVNPGTTADMTVATALTVFLEEMLSSS